MKKDNKVSTIKIEKICETCGKKYECSYKSRNTSKYCSQKCRTIAHKQRKLVNIDTFVICPICKLKFKHINNSHIWSHDMTLSEWEIKFPNFNRVSDETRKNKATLKNLTEEQSKKLKEGHTLKGFIKKYGEKDGEIKFREYKNKMKYIGTKQYYIDKYGEEIGLIKYKEIYKNKGLTKEKYINKYGEEIGLIKYDEMRTHLAYTKTLKYYIEKFGEKEGLEKWFNKNERMSKSSSSINVDDIDEYKKYCMRVDKETRITLQYNTLKNIKLRGKDYHLDHKISKCYGFNNNIDPKIIANIFNLEIIPASENLSKQKHCSITIDELKNKIIEN